MTVDPSGAPLLPKASGYNRPTIVAAAASRGTATHTPSAGSRRCTWSKFRASTRAVPDGGIEGYFESEGKAGMIFLISIQN